MLTILFYLFIAVLIIEILQYTIVYGRLAFASHNKKNKATDFEPVSVIVYIKDHQEQLTAFLTSLINQNYPTYEIILVNNASEDNSLEILESFERQFPNAKLVNVANNEAFWGNKKYALTLGIKVTSYDRYVFIDPTVTPISLNWLSSLTNNFSSKKQIVIGHTSIQRKKRSFANNLLRYQNTFKTINLFSWAAIGKPFRGNAQNQAYNKDLFFKVNGFIEHMKTPYGDEYAFINQIGTRSNVATATHPDSFVVTETDNKFSTWSDQMKTNDLLLKSSKVSSNIKVRFFNLCLLVFFISFTILISFLHQWEIVVGLFVFRYILVYIYNTKLFKLFLNKDLLWTLPILEIIHIFISTYYSVIHFISRKKI